MRIFMSMLFTLLSATWALAWGPLVEPDGALDGAMVIDIRSPDDFAAGHIPGAVNTPYGLYRGPQDNPGRVPDLADLQQTLRNAGAAYGREILVVHQGKDATDFGAAARVYWTLKSAGFKDLAVLNGGYAAWEGAGNTPTTEVVTLAASDITLSWSDEWMMDSDGVEAVVNGTSQAVLLDARPLEFFKAEKKHGAAAEAGTLRGALNLVHSTWFGGDGPIVDAPQDMLTRIKDIAGENADAPLVSFCNTGHWAATNWFAASELAGIEGVKLYPESMVGWTKLGKEVVDGTK
jgi:thiosulfate/3-mercaptopyruvate sulfurtransferase